MAITCAEMEKALRDSIELRWKRIVDGKINYPGCQLCAACMRHIGITRKDLSPCQVCPLYLAGELCSYENSLWQKYIYADTKKSKKVHAKAILNKLIELHNFYFPKGWDKKQP